jgi:hypothetical protein
MRLTHAEEGRKGHYEPQASARHENLATHGRSHGGAARDGWLGNILALQRIAFLRDGVPSLAQRRAYLNAPEVRNARAADRNRGCNQC